MDGMRLDGRTAVVTGGAGGMGRAICAELAGLGARVVVADVDEAGAQEVAGKHEGAVARRVDLADADDIDRFVEGAGAVDVLVHNAGISIVEPFVSSDPAGWDLMWRINLRAPMQLTRGLLPGMTERGWGRLVFISSDGARAGAGGEGGYAATKAGLFGLAKCLAREAARGGVTSNVVCPGPTDTPMMRGGTERDPALLDKFIRQIPLRRIGRPDDVAGLVAFLCGGRASYITGQILSVSGGITMH